MNDPAPTPRLRSKIATPLRAVILSSLLAGLAGCGGPPPDETAAIDCGSACAQDALSAAEVERIVAQAVVAAQSRGLLATIAVTDRPGNVLAVYAMTGTAPTFVATRGTPSASARNRTPDWLMRR